MPNAHLLVQALGEESLVSVAGSDSSGAELDSVTVAEVADSVGTDCNSVEAAVVLSSSLGGAALVLTTEGAVVGVALVVDTVEGEGAVVEIGRCGATSGETPTAGPDESASVCVVCPARPAELSPDAAASRSVSGWQAQIPRQTQSGETRPSMVVCLTFRISPARLPSSRPSGARSC